jgi:hypothetical protein
MANLQGVLASIPGIGGYEASRQQNQQMELGQLQQMSALQGILSKARAEQENEQLKGMLAGGTDPKQAIAKLLASGNPRAIEIAAKLHSLLPKPVEERVVSPGSVLLGPDNKPIYNAPFAPRADKGEWSDTYDLDGVKVQKNSVTGEIRTAVSRPPQVRVTNEPAPIIQTDEQGNTRLYDRSGNLIRDLGKTGKPSAEVTKTREAQIKLGRDVNEAILGLERISKKGGDLEKATGSGIGAAVDVAAGVFGVGTEGAQANARIKPIFDQVLKMVPRFEGPQSDKDTQSYKDAAGQLAAPNIPTSVKAEAAKTILAIMKRRRGQFTSPELGGAPAPSGGGWKDV